MNKFLAKTEFIRPTISFVMLISGILMSVGCVEWFLNPRVALIWYIIAYIPVSFEVLQGALKNILDMEFFTEFTLMAIATIGAFILGEYPEGVAVMLFYTVGETLNHRALHRARHDIQSLIEFRPEFARIVDNAGKFIERVPEDVMPGDIIEVRPGERVPLDGVLLSESAMFNTAALTGESVPRLSETGAEIPAGVISQDSVVRMKVLRKSSESAISRILNMVEDAQQRKAPAELFMRKFAKVYTPIVIVLSASTFLIPFVYSMITGDVFDFDKWFYRSLIFLVISCPCALVISIPLGYFAGIGSASRRGILFKGGCYLDSLAKADTVLFDKTGTLTTGKFAVKETTELTQGDIDVVASIEKAINHPVANAISACGKHTIDNVKVKNIAGYGVEAEVNGAKWLVGTVRLMEKEGISCPEEVKQTNKTVAVCAADGKYKGYFILADMVRDDAASAVANLKKKGMKIIEILSGDRQEIVDEVSREVNADGGRGELLPDGKAAYVEKLKAEGRSVVFVGDGINDAPVIALSDVGVAMGAMGSDMAIETADVVIADDRPSRLAEAVRISRRTRSIIMQNIIFIIGVKVAVMLLGVMGFANLWCAVFADVGVAMLSVMNAMRIMQKKKVMA